MTDRLTDIIRDALTRLLPDWNLHRLHPCTLRSQKNDRSVAVELDDGAPVAGASEVPVYYGLPAVQCKFKPGARARLGFESGDEHKRFVALFDPYPPKASNPELPVPVIDVPVDEISIAAGDKGAARVGDACDAGQLTWIPSPPAGGIPTGGILQYQAPFQNGGYPPPVQWTIVGPVAITPDPMSGLQIRLTAVITEGSNIVKIGG